MDIAMDVQDSQEYLNGFWIENLLTFGCIGWMAFLIPYNSICILEATLNHMFRKNTFSSKDFRVMEISNEYVDQW